MQAGYAVIFLTRVGSIQPFTQGLPEGELLDVLLQMFSEEDGQGVHLKSGAASVIHDAVAATRTLTAGDRASLNRYLQDATNCEPAQRRLADSRLHLAIAATGGSPSVTAVVAEVQMRLDELLRAIPVIPANIAHSDVQHARIVEAILGGQADRARSEMEEHVDGTAALLRGFLR